MKRKNEKFSEKRPLFQKKVVFLQPISVETEQMVGVAQLVRVPDCGSEGRGFESHLPPKRKEVQIEPLFCCISALFGKKCVLLRNNSFKL